RTAGGRQVEHAVVQTGQVLQQQVQARERCAATCDLDQIGLPAEQLEAARCGVDVDLVEQLGRRREMRAECQCPVVDRFETNVLHRAPIGVLRGAAHRDDAGLGRA